MRSLLFLTSVALFVACSTSETSSSTPTTTDDAGTDSGTTRRDSGEIDPDPDPADAGTDGGEPLTEQQEQEPNNGTPATAVNAMTIPGSMTGAIDPANDSDIFSITPAAGELWEWKLAPTGADLAPHVTVFDTAPDNLNPTVLAKGAAGETATIQHFVLGGGKWVAAVRDARNVPTGTGKGGPTYGYTFTAKKLTPQLTTIAVGETKSGTLASLSSVALFKLTLSATTGLDVVVRAERKASASSLDSRLSVWSNTTKKSIGTNDDATGTSDPELGGDAIPAGTYTIVLENEGTDATDLSYELEVVAR
jgi:hypothetical protein